MAHTKETIVALLITNDLAVERAILALYAKQTSDERNTESTRYVNRQGFNSSDARYLSYLARWLLAGNHLNANHMARARKSITKYAKQLANIANAKAAENTTVPVEA